MHLDVAERIRSELVARQGENGRLARCLIAEWPAFYLGSVAPDYQTICDIPREDTHFYPLPPEPYNQAWPRMLAQHRELADASLLPPDQAVFIAAYSAHLMLDLLWFREILVPYFFRAADIGDVAQRRLLHNILLTYLDMQALETLPRAAAETLAAAEPCHWLPFAADADLVRWRDMLVAQLWPGAEVQTIAIYAERLGIAPEVFRMNIEDPAWMQTQVFDKIPVDKVQARLATAVPASIEILEDYLQLLD